MANWEALYIANFQYKQYNILWHDEKTFPMYLEQTYIFENNQYL